MLRLPAQTVIYLPELLKYVNDATDNENKKDLIKQYEMKNAIHASALTAFIELMWNPLVQWDLPEGNPPYTPASTYIGESPSNLFKVFREVDRFLKGGMNHLQNPSRRELYYITKLESLSKDEAELLCQIKNRKLTSFPNVTYHVFMELYPNLFEAGIVNGDDFLDQGKTVNLSISDSVSTSDELIVSTPKSKGRPKKVTK